MGDLVCSSVMVFNVAAMVDWLSLLYNLGNIVGFFFSCLYAVKNKFMPSAMFLPMTESSPVMGSEAQMGNSVLPETIFVLMTEEPCFAGSCSVIAAGVVAVASAGGCVLSAGTLVAGIVCSGVFVFNVVINKDNKKSDVVERFSFTLLLFLIK